MADASIPTSSKIASRETLLSAFEGFRNELNDYHDRRERLIKTSRDITNLSKKAIFLLHRLVIHDLADESTFAKAAAQGRKKLVEIQALFRRLKHELVGEEFWRHQRSISPGLQEYIEALSFTHYLETGRLISYDEVQKTLCDEDGEPIFPLPLDDYLLGLSDLTGELMRFAISAISQRGGRNKAREVSDFVRNCKADFEGFTPYVRFLSKKQHVTAQSLTKIEDAAYAIAVRASEYEGSEELLEQIVQQYISEVRNHGDRGGHWQGRYGDRDDSEDEESTSYSL